MREMSLRRLALLAPLVLGLARPAVAKDPVYHLSIGDPARKDKDAAVVLDAITDTATGETIAPAALGARLAKARLVLVGESHTSVESHRVELQVIRALHDAGRHVTIALEMFPYTGQAGLDGWNGGWNEEEFLTRSHWYDVWGYHWGYYREIFNYARGTGMKFVAANAPREVVDGSPAERPLQPARRSGRTPAAVDRHQQRRAHDVLQGVVRR